MRRGTRARGESEPQAEVTPHDAFAKLAFRDRRRAAEALAAALGPRRAALIDWATLEPEPTELSDGALSRFFPDLRFRASLEDRDVRIDVIFEHQSAVDPLMPVRLFCETAAIWSAARRQRRSRVPLVLNVVLYNGLAPWTGPRSCGRPSRAASITWEGSRSSCRPFP